MGSLGKPIEVVGRFLLGIMFVMAAFNKFGAMDGFAQYMEGGGIPGVLAWPAALFELVAGTAIIVGFQTRIAALLLAGFCIVTAALYHLKPDDALQMTMAMKNFAIAGGMLVLAYNGAGPFSLDARRR